MRLTKKSKVYMSVTRVARSNKSRWIKVFTTSKGKIVDISDFVADKLELKYDIDKGIHVRGHGMDMCFWLAKSLGEKLFGDYRVFRYELL